MVKNTKESKVRNTMINILEFIVRFFLYMCGDTIVSPGLASAAKTAFNLIHTIDSDKAKPCLCVSLLDNKRMQQEF